MIYRKLVPSSLLGRSLIIIFIPLISVVTITTLIFYQTSWNIISKRLTQSVVADINVIVKLIDQDLKYEAIQIAREDFKMKIIYEENTNLNPLLLRSSRGILSKRLKQSLEDLRKPFYYDLSNIDQGAKIGIQIQNDLLIIFDNINSKIILFNGDLGTGKTTLIKNLCLELGSTENVSSPTFPILNTGYRVLHILPHL